MPESPGRALSDPTRRRILERLAGGPASIGELAEPFGLTLDGVKKHVGILEEVDLVVTAKVGRARSASSVPPNSSTASDGKPDAPRLGYQLRVLSDFATETIEANGVSINVCRGGAGPPVLLLHGYPQTHVMWHRVAPVLAEHFTVVCPDLRGYGDSDKPPGGRDHAAYSKRTMAQDQLEVMGALGFERFAVAAHDRGARVGLRMALDHPDAVSRLAILDIVPTKTIYETIDKQRATTVWRYFFLIQPHDLPERLIGSAPEYYLRRTLDEWCGTPGALTEGAVAEYRRCWDEATIHATCEDYRAGASIDLRHDQADADDQLSCPTLLLWSKSGIGAAYDVRSIWRQRARELRGRELDCGHFIAEERPDETAAELLAFLTEDQRSGGAP